MNFALAVLVGAITGVLSAFGIGGGTVLMIYMTLLASISQVEAQGINLLYFVPTSTAALFWHIKNGLIEKAVVIPAIICGVAASVGTSLLANSIDTELLRKFFGVFLILTGLWELFKKPPEEKNES